MAHVIKLKQNAVAPMVAHYERTPEIERGFERINIDSARTDQNYNLRPNNVLERVHAGIKEHEVVAGKGIRKDANVLCDWVVTAPRDLRPEDNRTFFEAVTRFCEQRYGEKNVLGAYVHMDETQPHVHVPILPQVNGKMQASKMVNRADLQSFHGDLSRSVEHALGYKVSIELDEIQKGEKQLSVLNQDEFIAAKAALNEASNSLESLSERACALKDEVKQLQDEKDKLGPQIASETQRLELLRRTNKELEAVLQQIRKIDSASIFGIGSRCRDVIQGITELANAARERIKEFKRLLGSVKEARTIAEQRRLGIKSFTVEIDFDEHPSKSQYELEQQLIRDYKNRISHSPQSRGGRLR